MKITSGRGVNNEDIQVPDWLRVCLAEFAAEAMLRLDSLSLFSFESRYFSTVFKITLEERGSRSGSTQAFFVKIPRASMQRGLSELPVPTSEDVVMARREYQAAERLAEQWPRGLTGFIRPVRYFEREAVLIYPWQEGRLLLRSWRSSNDEGRAVRVRTAALVGQALAAFHARAVEWREGPHADISGRFHRLVADLRELGASTSSVPELDGLLVRLNSDIMAIPYSSTIKGFELRNIMETEGGRLALFDPGNISREPIYTDIARFIVSCKMIWWGGVRFPFWYDVASDGIRAFLTSYAEEQPLDSSLVALFTLRELLKQWRMGLRVVAVKGLPQVVAGLLQELYVNRPFARLAAQEAKLCASACRSW